MSSWFYTMENVLKFLTDKTERLGSALSSVFEWGLAIVEARVLTVIAGGVALNRILLLII